VRVTDVRPVIGAAATGRRVAATVVLSVLALLLLAPATPASAHAVLTGSSPSDGEALEAVPGEVRLSFNEPVTANEGALRVFDAEGERVDTGLVDDGDGSSVVVELPDGLGEAAYVAAYRVVSADSHPIAGTITFTVGDAAALDAEAVAAIAGVGSGWVGTVGSVLRGLGYVGTLLAAGAVIFAVVVARGPADRARAASVGRPAALVGAVAVAIHLPFQAAAVSGFGPLQVLTDPGALGDTLTSGFGQSWLARIAALLALTAPWYVRRAGAQASAGGRAGTRNPTFWLGAAAALALGSFLLDGHQRTFEPTWLLVGGDAIHLAGAAAWFGGIVLLLVTLRGTRLEDDPVGAATVLARFSRLALWSVLALALAGTAMSLPLVRSLDALTSTTYGWLLLTKVGVVAVVVAIAAYNNRQLVPAITARVTPAGGSTDADLDADTTAPVDGGDPTVGSDAAWGQLLRTVRIEVVLLVTVLGLTGFLVTTQPAAEEAGLTGPTMLNAPLSEELTLDVTITPSAAGLNTVHVYTVAPSGQPTAGVEDLRLEFTFVEQDIGPFVVEPFVAGPGHWTATIDDLRFAGDWEVRVVGGLSRFEEADVTFPFTVS
jgi:copper transport protein